MEPVNKKELKSYLPLKNYTVAFKINGAGMNHLSVYDNSKTVCLIVVI